MKRREFLKGSATGAATLAGAAAASSPAKPAIGQSMIRWRMQTTWPKNFPGLGTGANVLAKFITDASGGRLTVEVYGVNEIVPAFETMDAVSSGTLEMGHGAPYYWKDKVPASQFIASVPLDPFDGKPLRYRRRNSGGYILYTIGEDGIDNNGLTREQAKKNTGKRSKEYDFAFTVKR